jgi:hypothetical protein
MSDLIQSFDRHLFFRQKETNEGTSDEFCGDQNAWKKKCVYVKLVAPTKVILPAAVYCLLP